MTDPVGGTPGTGRNLAATPSNVVSMTAPTIAVTTPTGNVGSELTRMLVRAGVRPRLLMRSSRGLPADLTPYTDVVEVDQTDEQAVLESTRGADAMFWVAPAGTDPDDPVGGYRRLGEIAATAAVENDIDRVVFQSSVGAEARHGFGEIDGLGAAEEALDATGRSVTHLRNGYFFTNLLQMADQLREGALPTTFPLDFPLAWVSPRDIASVAAGLLLSPTWRGRHVQAVHGPQDLSFIDVAQLLTEMTGRPIEAVHIADEDLAAALTGAGMSEAAADGIVGMARGFRSGFRAADPRTPVTTTPTTLAEWLGAHRAALGLGRDS